MIEKAYPVHVVLHTKDYQDAIELPIKSGIRPPFRFYGFTEGHNNLGSYIGLLHNVCSFEASTLFIQEELLDPMRVSARLAIRSLSLAARWTELEVFDRENNLLPDEVSENAIKTAFSGGYQR